MFLLCFIRIRTLSIKMPKYKSSKRRSSRHSGEEKVYHKHRSRAYSRDRKSRERSRHSRRSRSARSSDRGESSRDSLVRDNYSRDTCTRLLEQVRSLIAHNLQGRLSEVRSPARTVSSGDDDMAPPMIPAVGPTAERQTVAQADRGVVPGMSTCRPTYLFFRGKEWT